MQKYLIIGLLLLIIALTAIYFVSKKSMVQISKLGGAAALALDVPEASSSKKIIPVVPLPIDIEPQPKMVNPPDEVRGIYLTAWTAGSSKRVDQLIALMKEKNLNGVVIDIKDYSGYVSYKMDIPDAVTSGAEKDIRIIAPNALLKKFHDNGIYVIARVTVFQDPIFAKAHPELALQSKASGKTWHDRKGLAWLDPAGEDSWAYVAAIGNDALHRGFDEINFDYLRFPSDGNLRDIRYPFWNEKTPQHTIIRNFFAYLDSRVDGAISADLFGLSTSAADDLGIGQKIQDSYPYFEFVSPMVYPSHYATGYLGFKNPADHPYEVVHFSMESALRRLVAQGNATSAPSSTEPIIPPKAKLRPWLQVFDLGAVYTKSMVQKQIQAVQDTFASSSGAYGGWLLWDPKNLYTPLK